jgi:DNA-binding NarL/FixJ family response regulator
MPISPISVALIEDNRLVREGIVSLLRKLPDVRVVAGESSANYAVLRDLRPAVVLLDLAMRNGDSLRFAKSVKAEFPHSRIIVMDLIAAQKDIVEYVNAGVSGFIMKDATLEELAQTIRAVASGAHVLPPQMTSTLFTQIARDSLTKTQSRSFESPRMTPREREVIDLIASGCNNKEISAKLQVATHTVKSHVRNIMEKLTLHTRLQIAAYAHRNGGVSATV